MDILYLRTVRRLDFLFAFVCICVLYPIGTMESRLRVLASLLAVLFLNANNVNAFHKESGGRRTFRNRRTDPARVESSDVAGTRQSEPSRSSKFKNIEDLLETFRAEPVLVAFTSVNCGPCKLQKKELATVSQIVGNGFKMFAIDTEKWPHVGSRFKVGTLPCLVVVKEGEVILRLEGLTKAAEVVSRLVPIYGLAL
jgi:thiol-disulfide isomerase/thioredoxin